MKTKKAQALDFVEQNGPSTWKEVQNFLLKISGYPQTREYRGYFSSYFSELGCYGKATLLYPNKKDPRYLEKRKDGLYCLKRKYKNWQIEKSDYRPEFFEATNLKNCDAPQIISDSVEKIILEIDEKIILEIDEKNI